jgi:hypothetical protein
VTLSGYIGAKLYYWGFRMQPPPVRRGLSLISQVGLLWSELNPELLERAMRGEKLDLGVDLRTQEMPPADRVTPSPSASDQPFTK